MLLLNEPARKNRILSQYLENKSDKFLMEECFMWTLEPQVWQDMCLLNYPAPPKEWVEYENLGALGKSKVGEEFFHQFVIKEYLARKSGVYAHNFGIWDWLKQMRKFFPRDNEHIVLHKRIVEKLEEFNQWFIRNHPDMEKVEKKLEVPEKQSPEVETIKEIFGAENIY
jgi:hypothetical protein